MDKILFFLVSPLYLSFFVVVFEVQDIISLERLESKPNFLGFLFPLAIIQEASFFWLLNTHVCNTTCIAACIVIIYFLAVTL